MIKYLFFLFIPFLLLIPIEVDAIKNVVGKDFDSELIGIKDGIATYRWTSHYDRILNDTWQFVNFIVTEDTNQVKVESGLGSIIFDKNNCNAKTFPEGRITGSTISNADLHRFNIYEADSGLTNWINITGAFGSCSTVVTENTDDIIIKGTRTNGANVWDITYTITQGGIKTGASYFNDATASKKYKFIEVFDGQFKKLKIKFTDGTEIEKEEENFSLDLTDPALQTEFELELDTGNFRYNLGAAKTNAHQLVSTNDMATLSFDFANVGDLNPGETLVLDPTFTNAVVSQDGSMDENDNNDICDQSGSYIEDTANVIDWVRVFADADARDCSRSFLQWSISGIPDTATIDSVTYQFELLASGANQINCDIVEINTDTIAASTDTIWQRIDTGNVYINNNAFCVPDGATNQEIILGTQANIDLQARLVTDDLFGIGLKADNEVHDGSEHNIYTASVEAAGVPDPTIVVIYNTNAADPVNDLTGIATAFNRITLDWTTPDDNGFNIVGYRINRTLANSTYPPTDILVNDTGNLSTIFFDTFNLFENLTYAYQAGPWVDDSGGLPALNDLGNSINVTTPLDFTQVNFTVGFASINASAPDARDIRYERIDINSTALFLNVTYSNEFDLSCNFYYKFARTNNTYNNLANVTVDADFVRSDFLFNEVQNEIIDVVCRDVNTNTTANFLITITDFPLLNQFVLFRSGEFGTDGMFGALDLITLSVILVSMVGFNRVNPSVGIVFTVAILGALAYFDIVEWYTFMLGSFVVIVVLTVSATRKI